MSGFDWLFKRLGIASKARGGSARQRRPGSKLRSFEPLETRAMFSGMQFVNCATGVPTTSTELRVNETETVCVRLAEATQNVGEYRLRVRGTQSGFGSEWKTVADWNPSSTFAWALNAPMADVFWLAIDRRDLTGSIEYVTPVPVTRQNVMPATGGTISSSKPFGAVMGTRILFTGAGAGASLYEYQYRLRDLDKEWQIARPYSQDAQWEWNLGSRAVGTYFVELSIRALGSPSSYDVLVTPIAQEVVLSASVPNIELVPLSAAAVSLGSTVSIAIQTSVTTGFEFAFVARGSTSEWEVIRSYQSSTEFHWNLTGRASDIYYVGAFVRQVGSDARYEGAAIPIRFLVTNLSPVSSVTASSSSPRVRRDEPFQLQATASGDLDGAEYRVRYRQNSEWSVLKSYSAQSQWQFIPDEFEPGDLYFEVGARAAGSPADYDAYAIVRVEILNGVNDLWQSTLESYLEDPLWQDLYAEDAAHTLQVALAYAFEKGHGVYQQAFADHFTRFLQSGERTQEELWRVEYYYLAARFISLAAEQGKFDLIPAGLPEYLFQEIHDLWLTTPAWFWERPSFQGMRERLLWKLGESNPEFSYYRAVFDHEGFLMAAAHELRAYQLFSGTMNQWNALIQDILDVNYFVYQTEVVWQSQGGWLFQPGVWTDHPNFQYAGHASVGPNLAKYPVAGIGEDSSHAIRRPLFLASFLRAYPVSDARWQDYRDLQVGLEIQFYEVVVDRATAESPVFLKNYMDGRNGLYRYNYETVALYDAFEANELSGTFFYGWWAFLRTPRVQSLHAFATTQFPLPATTLNVYVGPNTNRPRHPLEYDPGAFSNGMKELLVLMASRLELDP